jgi:LmbE family N-acetylglucosaminyl deacetylase
MSAEAKELIELALARRGEGVLFVGAHPDDESFALGGHLGCLPKIGIVIVTDGAPRDLRDAHNLGFEAAEQYAAARQVELANACAVAGIPASQITSFAIPDQQPVFDLPGLSRRLKMLIETRGPWMVLTHAFEGGHPDHDAVAFGVHAAIKLISREGGVVPALLEMPYYRVGPDGQPAQGFEPGSGTPVHQVDLTDDELDLKVRMLHAHTSQQQFLDGTEGFRNRRESFRVAGDHDFSQPPNQGRFLYESWQLGVTGERWMAEARKALRDLGLA